MKIVKKIANVIDSCTSTAIALFGKIRKKVLQLIKLEDKGSKPETSEESFLREWTLILTDHARVFNGLFNGLKRVQNGTAKKPEKVLREWSQRTHYKWENEPVDRLCQEQIVPLIEAEDRESLTKWACLLLDAATAAGISIEETETLVLTEENADAYVEWDGNELYPEDEIEIITPAWYQNGKVLEQGQCRKRDIGAR